MKKFRSKFEERIDKELTKARAKFEYETEAIPYTLHRHYIPDFIIHTKKGNKIYVECKGYLRPADRAKLTAVIAQHPNVDLRIVFYSFSKTNVKWADRVGLKWAIKEVPKDWLR